MKRISHEFDFCVVGGGMAGLSAAISAARHGAKVALIQDRPVLGGNASSEIRMEICGAHGNNRREAGILEELRLENLYRNPGPNYSIWDSVTYGAAQYQDNVTLFLNCSVNECTMDGSRIESVTGWQLTTETRHTIRAKLFADCSGDGILAPLSGANFRIGREARSEFNESIAPETTDAKTMGMTCLFQAREHETPQSFVPPNWAYTFSKPEDLRGRDCNIHKTNYWWMEVGGEHDSIHDTEYLRAELLKIAFGVWDYIKNRSDIRDSMANWALDWQGFLPGKRESRRYLGDHILTQNDVEAEGRFEDIVAYGGWSMDDHFPAGFYHPQAGTIFHPAPSPYGIPLGSLYSSNIDNLFCAGRCHSATHCAMSSTRVMATTSLMGQAVGTAAAIAIRDTLIPRQVRELRIAEVQQILMEDDCWLPWHSRKIPELSRKASIKAETGDPEQLRTGRERPLDGQENSWRAPLGAAVTYEFETEMQISEARIVFDSDLNSNMKNMTHKYARGSKPRKPPSCMVKSFAIETMTSDGAWKRTYTTTSNYQRLVRVPLNVNAKAVRLVPQDTWGARECNVFAFDVS